MEINLPSVFRPALLVLFCGTGLHPIAGQALETYRVQHRPVADVERIAEQAMGNEGQVTLDSRTATLILSGSPAAVERTLALLSELDRPLRHVSLEYEIRDARDFEDLEAGVRRQVSVGSVRMGTLGPSRSGVSGENGPWSFQGGGSPV